MGSAIFAKEMRPVVDTTWFFEGGARGGQQWVLPRLAGDLVVPLRMLNGPSQVETGRRNGGGKPQQYAEDARSQGLDARRSRTDKSLAARNGSILASGR